jgi:hypothetical protein
MRDLLEIASNKRFEWCELPLEAGTGDLEETDNRANERDQTKFHERPPRDCLE